MSGRYADDSWTQIGDTISPSDVKDLIRYFGMGVALDSAGDTLALTAPSGEESKVYIFDFDGSSWSQSGDFSVTNDQSFSQISLSADGNTVAVGDHNNDDGDTNAGAVAIYRNSGGNWSQLGSTILGEAGFDQSGHTVQLNSDGTRVVIGALNNDGNGDSAGHVRVYEYSNSEWTQMGSDIDGDAEDDRLGDAVSINSDGTVIAIGATGHDVVANVTTSSVTIRAYPNKRAGNHVHNSHFSVATAGNIASGSEVVANKVVSGVSGYSLTDSDPWVAVYTRGNDGEEDLLNSRQ